MSEETSAVDLIARERIHALDRRISDGLITAEKAVLKAENAMEKRFDGVNEFRAALSDQQKTMATTDMVDAKVSALDARVKILENLEAGTRGRGAGADYLWRSAMVVLGGLVGAGGLFLALSQAGK